MAHTSTHVTNHLLKPFPLRRNYYVWVIPSILVFVVLLSVALWFAITHVTRTIYLEQALSSAERIADTLDDTIPEAWHALQRREATPDQLASIRHSLEEEIERQRLLKLKAYDLTATVVFSFDPRPIGDKETALPMRQALATAEPQLKEKIETDGSMVYEIYTPVFDAEGHLIAIFELYEPVTYLNDLIHKTAIPAIAVPVVMQFLFVLVLGMLVKRGQHAIDERTRAITQLTDRLKTFVSDSAISAALGASSIEDIPSQHVTTTLFHSDVRDFTSFAENNTPERVVFFLNDLMTIQVGIIQKFGGDIDKMIGDALLVRFNGKDAERRAIEASQKILDQVARTSQPRGLGIGLYTGPVISGAIGPKDRRDFTVIGDSVNMSARLCAQAKSGELVTDQDTLKASGVSGFSAAENVTVKGRSQPIAINRWQVDAR